jgi:hypothetical protein
MPPDQMAPALTVSLKTTISLHGETGLTGEILACHRFTNDGIFTAR